jgi:uncharacterized protein with PIN domain
MADKCYLCNEKLEKTFLDKIAGTIVKIKKGEKNEQVYVCSSCQKKHKDLKKEIEKKK